MTASPTASSTVCEPALSRTPPDFALLFDQALKIVDSPLRSGQSGSSAARLRAAAPRRPRARVVHGRCRGYGAGSYRGLKKNTHRLLVTCALANLFIARRRLLRCAAA
jgi:hypothetical protein